MKVSKIDIPQESQIYKYIPADYTDAFNCIIDHKSEINPDDILINFWTDMPVWINSLFKIRNFLVKFIGLEGSENRDIEKLKNCIRTGGEYGFVSIPEKSDNETIMLLKDKHLDAYISVHVDNNEKKQKVSAITLVKFNNKLGNFYFFFIRPFHNIIVKYMLKRSIRSVI